MGTCKIPALGINRSIGPSFFSVSLTSVGDKKINVIKEVRAVTGLGLKEAKELVDSAPKAIKEGLEKEEAEVFQQMENMNREHHRLEGIVGRARLKLRFINMMVGQQMTHHSRQTDVYHV